MFIGHCTVGGSDKVWAGSLHEGTMYVLYGRRGGRLSTSTKKATEKKFASTVRSKQKKGYEQSGDEAVVASVVATARDNGYPQPVIEQFAGDEVVPTVTSPTPMTDRLLFASLATPASEEALSETGWGATEKANGVRCLLRIDETGAITAYNRSGQPVAGLPTGVEALTSVGPCIFDGEQVSDGYVIFDLLAVGQIGESGMTAFRSQPFAVRLAHLQTLMDSVGIAGSSEITGEGPLWFLMPVTTQVDKQALYKRVKGRAGEGVILRKMFAPSNEGRDPSLLKVKYTPTMDVRVVATNLDRGRASLKMALVRPEDGELIDVGNVRSGLTDERVAEIEGQLEAGETLVAEVAYLAARTVGMKLVEPVFLRLRDDKDPAQCTTDQYVRGDDQDHVTLVASASLVA